jgi:tyrosyl-tRNA synthetase
LELIRKVHGIESKAYGFTFPLVTKADGTKFGKTESGAVWLDKDKTSPYEFYQYWINTSDDDVVMRLKQFTFLSVEAIESLENEVKQSPEKRTAQKALATELTKLVHGEEALKEAEKISEALFSGDLESLTAHEIEMGFKDLLGFETESDLALMDALLNTNIAQSKREARELISSGAISFNGNKLTNLDSIVSKKDAIEGVYSILRKGKKKYVIIKHK